MVGEATSDQSVLCSSASVAGETTAGAQFFGVTNALDLSNPRGLAIATALEGARMHLVITLNPSSFFSAFTLTVEATTLPLAVATAR